ncbi:UPF0716 protein FxsA [Haloactinopolyspora alba]|uniref:UPF0716 protein FxsA n=1 Tax=Haloactinopolyspora alba TaxID=648780 RepID=A0A2P8DY92_9ACTN|nr:FxsA family protein [Haloactinopolyspora alba]PSL02184.1 UPF0716 protein FxsA [Haloactinopolyspora alba]
MSGTTGRGLRGFGPFLAAVAEIVVFVLVSGWIGFGWTLLLLLSTSVVGFALLRFEGFRAWTSLRQAAAEAATDGADEGAGSTARMADTGVRVLAGVLLTLPGFVTDLFAVVLLIPPVRRSTGRRLSAAAFRTFPAGGARPGAAGRGQRGPQQGPVVIEGEVVDDPDASDGRS